MMISSASPVAGASVTGVVLAGVVAAGMVGGVLVVGTVGAPVSAAPVSAALVSAPSSASLPQPATRRAATTGTSSHFRGFDIMDRVSTGLLDWPAAHPATTPGTGQRQDV
jgi:hypothetical protein